MPLSDVIAAALSRPAARVVDTPVRDILDEVLRERGYAGPAEVQQLRDEIAALRKDLGALGKRVEDAEGGAVALRAGVADLEKEVQAATARAAAAEKRAEAAEQAAAAADAKAQAAEAHAGRVLGAAQEAEARAKAADDRAKVALNRTREALAARAPAPAPAPVAAPEPEPAPVSDDTVGPNGEVLVDGDVFLVDSAHAGKAYEVRGTKSRRVRIDGRFVKKTRA